MSKNYLYLIGKGDEAYIGQDTQDNNYARIRDHIYGSFRLSGIISDNSKISFRGAEQIINENGISGTNFSILTDENYYGLKTAYNEFCPPENTKAEKSKLGR
jgi:hypothetical protein